jgi:hypothetical protein
VEWPEVGSPEERATSLLAQVVAIVDAGQYFDVTPDTPTILAGSGVHTITLAIHAEIHGAQTMLAKGPHWAASPRHPFVKARQVWEGEEVVRYVYQLSDPSFAYGEGFHFHPEPNSQGLGVYHYVRIVGRTKTWAKQSHETPLTEALATFVDTIWQLRS